MTRSLSLLLFAAVAIAPSVVCADDLTRPEPPAYRLRPFHPAQAGDRREWTDRITAVETTDVSYQSARKTKSSWYHLEADVSETVLTASRSGQAVQLRLVCRPFRVGTVKGQTKALPCEGAAITVTRWPSYAATRDDGKPLSHLELRALRELAGPLRTDRADDAKVYALPESVHVGDAWEVDAKALRRLYAKSLEDYTVQEARGTVTIPKLRTVQGHQCAVVRYLFQFPILKVPREKRVVVDYGLFAAKAEIEIPVEGRAGERGTATDITTSVQGHIRGAHGVLTVVLGSHWQETTSVKSEERKPEPLDNARVSEVY